MVAYGKCKGGLTPGARYLPALMRAAGGNTSLSSRLDAGRGRPGAGRVVQSGQLFTQGDTSARETGSTQQLCVYDLGPGQLVSVITSRYVLTGPGRYTRPARQHVVDTRYTSRGWYTSVGLCWCYNIHLRCCPLVQIYVGVTRQLMYTCRCYTWFVLV